MKRILHFELMKIWNPLTLIYWVLFSVAFIVFSYDEPKFVKMFVGSGFRYSENIILNIFFISAYYKYLLALFIIYITAQEFSSNTIIRSVYEGFSRDELFVGRMVLLGLFVIFTSVLVRILLLLVFLIKGHSLAAIFFMLFNYHFVIADVFTCFTFGLLGILLCSVTKSLYWSVGIFTIWAYGEYQMFLFLVMTSYQGVNDYLPMNLMVNIQQKLMFNELTFQQVIYLYAIQLVALLLIYNRYKNITWLRKR